MNIINISTEQNSKHTYIAYEVVPLRIHLQGPFEVDGCQSTGMLLRSDSYHEHLTCLPDDESKTTKQCRKQ